jgi:cytochrome c oxidase cbb3-type subunit 4
MEIMQAIQSIWTVVVFVLFIGIVLWAWSGKNKKAFDEAARIPLDDDIDAVSASNEQEKETSNG